MTTLEILHLRLAWKNSEELIDLIRRTLANQKGGPEVRLYRHARFEGDLHVHLLHSEGEGVEKASALGEQLAALLRKHGMLDHSLWLEATGDDQD